MQGSLTPSFDRYTILLLVKKISTCLHVLSFFLSNLTWDIYLNMAAVLLLVNDFGFNLIVWHVGVLYVNVSEDFW